MNPQVTKKLHIYKLRGGWWVVFVWVMVDFVIELESIGDARPWAWGLYDIP